MKYNREYITLFLLFIRDHFFAASTRDDPYIRSYRGDSLIVGDYVSVVPCMASGESSKRLMVFLKLLKNLGEQIKTIYAEQILRDFVMNLLMRSDSEIQKMSIEILCNYYGLKQSEGNEWNYNRSERSHIKDYKDYLLQMCDEVAFRDCLTTFFLSASEGMIKTEDRFEMVLVISRILYGRLLSRSHSNRGSLSSKRAAVMSYLCTLEEDELSVFVTITCSGFFSQLISHIPTTIEEVNDAVSKLWIKREQISWRRITGLLVLLSDVIRTIAEKLQSYVHNYLIILAFTLRRVFENLGTDVEEEEEENEEETEDLNTITPQALKKLRTLCLRRMMELIGYYPSIDYSIYSPYFFTPLTPLLQSLPHSCIHAAKAPSLLRLTTVVSCNSHLSYIFDLQPLLVRQSILCLLDNQDLATTERRTEKGYLRRSVKKNMFGNLSSAVVMEVVQLIENLLRIDPEEDYFNQREKDKKRLRRGQGGIAREKEELSVMQTLVALKGEAMEVEEKDEDGLRFLIPQMNEMLMGIQYLIAVIPNIRGNLFNRLLSIIYHLSQLSLSQSFSLSANSLDQIFNLLVSFLQFSTARDDSLDNRLRILDAIDALVPLVSSYDEAVHELSALLVPSKQCIPNLTIRRRIIGVFNSMKERLSVFTMIVPILLDLHATNSSSIDTYNFAKRGDAYDMLIKNRLTHYHPESVGFDPLLACVLYDILDSDMMIRNTAMICLKEFVNDSAQLIQTSPDTALCSRLQYLVERFVMSVIKYELKNCTNDNIRRPIISLLRDIVLLWSFEISLIINIYRSLNRYPSLVLCSDLAPLMNVTIPENDVFLCLIDLKQKTRSKGLKHLTKILESIAEEKVSRISASTLRSILIPILFAYIHEFNRNQGIS